MIDPAQTALFLVVIVLTILLVVLGIQVFFILRELRKTIDKANKVLDDTGTITESVSKPISSLSSLAMGLKAGAKIARILNADKKHKKDE
jgi:phosphoglycerate-specific signal transduction histidine kinase